MATKSSSAILHDGRDILQRLKNGSLPPDEACHDVVRHYGAALERAQGPKDEIYRLISEGWLRAWEALEGGHDGFLKDVERAWRRADVEGDVSIAIQCSLCFSSVVSLSNQFSSASLASAAGHALLSSSQALAIARRKSDGSDRAEALMALLPSLRQAQREQALHGLLELAPSLNVSLRRDIVYALIPYLSEDLTPGTLELATKLDDMAWRVQALVELVPHLQRSEREQALDDAYSAARHIDRPGQRLEQLMSVSRHLTGEQRLEACAEAIEAARATMYPPARADRLIALSDRMDDCGLRERALDGALAAAREIESSADRAETLTRLLDPLAPGERPAVIDEALQAARAVEDVTSRVAALASLLPYLSGRRRQAICEEALKDAQKMTAGFISRLGPEILAIRDVTRDQQSHYLHIVRLFSAGTSEMSALRRLAPYLSQPQRDAVVAEVATAVEQLKSISVPSRLLESAWRRIFESDEGRFPELGESLDLTADELSRAVGRMKAALAGEPEESPTDAERAWRYLATEHQRFHGKGEAEVSEIDVRPSEPEEVRNELARALKISEPLWSPYYLKKLIPHLPEKKLKESLEVVLSMLRAENTPSWPGLFLLRPLVQRLPEELVAGALEQASSIEDPGSRACFLEILVPALPESLLAQVLVQVNDLPSRRSRQSLFTCLAARIPTSLMAEFLSLVARRLEDPRLLAEVLTLLVPRAPANVLAEIQAIVDRLDAPETQAELLMLLATHAGRRKRKKILRNALGAALNIKDVTKRIEAFDILASRLPKRHRKEILRDLERLGPSENMMRIMWMSSGLTTGIAGKELSYEDFFLWHIGVLVDFTAYLTGWERRRVFSQILKTVGRFGGPVTAVAAMSKVVPHIPRSLIPRALDCAKFISKPMPQAAALRLLAPHLTESLLADALALAKKIEKDSEKGRLARAKTLASLVPAAPEEMRWKPVRPWWKVVPRRVRFELKWSTFGESSGWFWKLLTPLLIMSRLRAEMRNILRIEWAERGRVLDDTMDAIADLDDEGHRWKLTLSLHGHLPADEQKRLVNECLGYVQRQMNHEAAKEILLGLVPHMPEHRWREALAAVRAMGNEETRIELIETLVPHLPEDLLPEAVAALTAPSEFGSRDVRKAAALQSIASYLPPTVLGEVLDWVRNLPVEDRNLGSPRVKTLAAIVPYLPPDLLPEALRVAEEIEEENWCYQAIAAVISHCSEELRAELLAGRPATGDDAILEDLMSAPTSGWSQSDPATVREKLCRALHVLGRRPQEEALAILERLLPTVVEVGGAATAWASFQSVYHVCRWWR